MKIAIIGGGAAGMMCAATVNEANPEAEVFLLEKNSELGKKVIISGGGRCNVTTGIEDLLVVSKKYPRGAKFLQSALHRFTPRDVWDWFEAHGVPLKREADQRVFPISNDGHDVVGAFTRFFAHSNTKVLLKHDVLAIQKEDVGFAILFKAGEPLFADRVVLSLGGQAYRFTGSTGDGYTLAEMMGHHITPLAPSLNSFVTLEKWPKSISGLSFKQATITANRVQRYSFTGPFLFTHSGVSGPAVFALSSLVAFEKYGPTQPLAVTIDLLPEISAETLFVNIKKLLQDTPKKSFKNTLHTLVPASLAELICVQLNIPLEKKNSEINKQTLRAALEWVKNIPLTVIGRGAGDEFVTAGGVELAEVDQRTMESKICPGLYLAGEILNVDGFTGGFNLQASWATGHAAGLGATN
ncbi:MAG: NAD(P)/FAD-dependent oxidoreductase [bacterium]|nr:NAD(P)/FAD-dependent oxidoreductase [bacterium]